jgi:hypothetical protein
MVDWGAGEPGASTGGLDYEDWTPISYVPHRPSKPQSEMIKIKSNVCGSNEVGQLSLTDDT